MLNQLKRMQITLPTADLTVHQRDSWHRLSPRPICGVWPPLEKSPLIYIYIYIDIYRYMDVLYISISIYIDIYTKDFMILWFQIYYLSLDIDIDIDIERDIINLKIFGLPPSPLGRGQSLKAQPTYSANTVYIFFLGHTDRGGNEVCVLSAAGSIYPQVKGHITWASGTSRNTQRMCWRRLKYAE